VSHAIVPISLGKRSAETREVGRGTMTSGFPGISHRYFDLRQTIVTNITEPDLTFDPFHGTFRQLP
jgi:hypothetical protein